MLFQFYIPIFQIGKGFLNILNHVFLLPYTKKPPFYNHVFQDNQYFTLFFSAITILLQTISQLLFLCCPNPSPSAPDSHPSTSHTSTFQEVDGTSAHFKIVFANSPAPYGLGILLGHLDGSVICSVKSHCFEPFSYITFLTFNTQLTSIKQASTFRSAFSRSLLWSLMPSACSL